MTQSGSRLIKHTRSVARLTLINSYQIVASSNYNVNRWYLTRKAIRTASGLRTNKLITQDGPKSVGKEKRIFGGKNPFANTEIREAIFPCKVDFSYVRVTTINLWH